MSYQEKKNFIVEVTDLLKKDHYWKEYSEIKNLKYESMKDYFINVIQPQIYYRMNEGIHYRDFEAWIMTYCWKQSYHYDNEYYNELIKTIKFFIQCSGLANLI